MRSLAVVVLSLIVLVPMLFLGRAAVSAPTPNPEVRAMLSGFDEVATLSTPGTGEFRGKITDTAIEYELSYQGVETAAFQAHIHLGRVATNGGVAAFLCGGGGKPPCPAFSGSVPGTIVAGDVIGPAGQGIAPGEFDELVRAILAGATYVNVHTASRPGGEIRGQISSVGR